MKKHFRKFCAVSLATVMMLSACGTDAPASVSTETKPTTSTTTESKVEPTKKEEMVTINVMMWDRGHEYTGGNSLTDNKYTRWINENMEPQGVHVEFVAVSRSNSDDVINLMLAGGEAPDIVRTYDRQRVASYVQQGGLLDLSDYVDQLDAGWLKDAENVLQYCEFDGGLYALPGVQAYYGKQHETYIRQDLVEAMGYELPKTKEELIDVLYAMHKAYPDIITWQFGGNNDNEGFNNWLLAYTTRTNERDNYIYEPSWTMALKPGAKDGLKVLNQLWLDGIINKDFYLDTDNSKYKENAANGKVGFLMQGDQLGLKAYDTVDDANYHMISIECIEDLDGNYEVPSSDPFSHYIYVPAASEGKIDAIIKFLNFLGNEETAVQAYYGVEGVGFNWIDGVPVATSRDEKLAAGTHAQPQDLGGFMRTSFNFEVDKLETQYKNKYPYVPADVAEAKVASQYSNYYDKAMIGTALPSDQYVPLLDEKIVELVYKCIAAPEGQFEEVYEAQYKILLENHLQDVLDERGAWYDANVAK